MAGQPAPLSNPFITFDVTALTVTESGLSPTTIIEVSKAFELNVSFVFAELLASWLVGLGFGNEVTVRYESLGAGPEGALGPVTVTTVAGSLSYTGTIAVPAGTLPVGPYRLLGSVIVPGSPIAGYVDGPILQII